MSVVNSGCDTMTQPSARAVFPPALFDAEYISMLEESDGKEYPRKFGCSSLLGDIPVFLFGDIYAQEPDSEGEFVRIATSGASFGSHVNPSVSSWPYPRNYSAFHNVPDLIPFTDTENKHNARSLSEGKRDRFYLWARSPILELPIGERIGIVFFTKTRTNDEGSDEHRGIGVAEIQVRSVGKGKGTDRELGTIIPVARRHGNLLFDHTHPKWGDIATIIEGDFIYLFGTHNAAFNTEDPSNCPIFLCRVSHRHRAYLFPRNYTYWDGEDFVQSSAERKEALDVTRLQPVMFGLSSGTIFYATFFSDFGGGVFIMIGSDCKDGGKVMMTYAENIWGPWAEKELFIDLGDSTGDPDPKSSAYVHLWASNLKQGRLLMSWGQGSNIEMANVFLQMSDGDSEGDRGNEIAYTRAGRGSSGIESLLREFNSISMVASEEGRDIIGSSSGLKTPGQEKYAATEKALAMLTGERPPSLDKSMFVSKHRVASSDGSAGCSEQEKLEGRRRALAKLSGEALNQFPGSHESVIMEDLIKFYQNGGAFDKRDQRRTTYKERRNTPHFNIAILSPMGENYVNSNESIQDMSGEYIGGRDSTWYNMEGAALSKTTSEFGESGINSSDGEGDSDSPNQQTWYTGDVPVSNTRSRRYSLLPLAQGSFHIDSTPEKEPHVTTAHTDENEIITDQRDIAEQNDHGPSYSPQLKFDDNSFCNGHSYPSQLKFDDNYFHNGPVQEADTEDLQVRDGKNRKPGHFLFVKKFFGKVFKPSKADLAKNNSFNKSTSSLQTPDKKGKGSSRTNFLRGVKSMSNLKKKPSNAALIGQTTLTQRKFSSESAYRRD